MSAYFQMGHDSENLIGGEGLDYGGIVLSPVNRTSVELKAHVAAFREKGSFDVVLDPQLYCPQHRRGHLPTYRYFPDDLETADLSNRGWWRQRIKLLAEEARELGADAVCSPAVLPRKFEDGYYEQTVEAFADLQEELGNSGPRGVLSLCVDLGSLATPDDAQRIASIATRAEPQWCYLVVQAEVTPRRELSDEESLIAVLNLVRALEGHGCQTIVSHTSSDMILFKAAGASHCATGKFFNLRRFTRGRFEADEENGGRNFPYWFEEGLLAFLREADIPALRREGFGHLIGTGFSDNHYGKQILEILEEGQGKAWVGLGWRQFLMWFCLMERSLSGPDGARRARALVRAADENWGALEEADVLFDERPNDGNWVRHWRRVLKALGS
jgi:hypothetical protein